METLHRFIQQECLCAPSNSIPPDEKHQIYKCEGSALKDKYNIYLGRLGQVAIGSKLFYAQLKLILPSIGATQVRHGSGYVILGLTIRDNIQLYTPRVTCVTAEDKLASHRQAQKTYTGKIRKSILRVEQRDPAPKIQPNNPTAVVVPVVSLVSPTVRVMATLLEPPRPLTIKTGQSAFGGFIPPSPMSPSDDIPEPPVQVLKPKLRIIYPGPRWDGSCLGRLDDNALSMIGKSDITGVKYYRLDYQGTSTIVTRRRATTKIPSIIDEIKGIFGVYKIGTHSCTTTNSYRYVLNYVPLDSTRTRIIEDTNVDSYTLTPCLIEGLRRIWVFRELIGVNRCPIMVRHTDQHLAYLLGIREASIDISGSLVLPDVVYSTWFLDWDANDTVGTAGIDRPPERECRCPISTMTARMLNVTNADEMVERLAALRTSIADTIYRIDRQEIGMLNSIMERISNRLSIALG
jgi:hypothetical protein